MAVAASPTGSAEIYVTDESFVKLSEPELNVQEINGVGETVVGKFFS